MNPMHQIGRHQLPLFNIETITQRGLFRFVHPFCPYKVMLKNGQMIYFTEAEKAQYDEAITGHANIVRVLGMAHASGLPR